jgi:ubiquinone/menaquinone biosynthesis C-methylase UbiE
MIQQEARLLRDDYVLGHSAEEYERLRRQAQMLEPATRRLFHSIGLRPGWTCLDLGCGPGESMRLMGEIVGPSGEVTGLDRDAKAGREAIERLQANRNKSIPIYRSEYGEH